MSRRFLLVTLILSFACIHQRGSRHLFLVVLDCDCGISVKIEIIFAFAASHGAIVAIGIEMVIAFATDQDVFAIPGEDSVVPFAALVIVSFSQWPDIRSSFFASLHFGFA